MLNIITDQSGAPSGSRSVVHAAREPYCRAFDAPRQSHRSPRFADVRWRADCGVARKNDSTRATTSGAARRGALARGPDIWPVHGTRAEGPLRPVDRLRRERPDTAGPRGVLDLIASHDLEVWNETVVRATARWASKALSRVAWSISALITTISGPSPRWRSSPTSPCLKRSSPSTATASRSRAATSGRSPLKHAGDPRREHALAAATKRTRGHVGRHRGACE